jgi:outer membrane lipoprotein-sorting protein
LRQSVWKSLPGLSASGKRHIYPSTWSVKSMSLKGLKIGMAVLLAMTAILLSLAPAAENKSESDARLETLLQEWKKADHQIRELHSTFTVTTEDRILKDRTTSRGEAFFKKPDLARIDFKDQEGKLPQIWLYKGKTLRLYNFTNQIEEVGPIDLDASQDWLTKWMASTFKLARWAFPAAPFDEAQKRFHFHLNKEDKYWAYIQLEPRNPKDFVDFKEMEVVLNQKTHLVRQIRYSTSGHRMILDFDKIEINPTPPITWESISKDLPKKLKKEPVSDR